MSFSPRYLACLPLLILSLTSLTACCPGDTVREDEAFPVSGSLGGDATTLFAGEHVLPFQWRPTDTGDPDDTAFADFPHRHQTTLRVTLEPTYGDWDADGFSDESGSTCYASSTYETTAYLHWRTDDGLIDERREVDVAFSDQTPGVREDSVLWSFNVRPPTLLEYDPTFSSDQVVYWSFTFSSDRVGNLRALLTLSHAEESEDAGRTLAFRSLGASID